LTGRQTPDTSKPVNKNDLSTSINSYKIDQLEIGNINAEVGLSDSSGLVTKLSNLHLDNGHWNQGKTSFDQLKANITSARYWKDSTSYSMGESTLQSDSFSAFSNISMVNPGKHSLKVQGIMLSPFKATPDGLDIRHLLISDVKYFNQTGQISTVGSVRLANVQLSDSAAPYVGEIQVYTPQINLTKNNSSEVKPNKEANSISPLSMFSRLSVSPGQIKSDCTAISFDHISVEPTGHRLSVDLQRLAFKTPSSSVHIEQVYSDSTNLYIDSI
jgi:hypothetical protein